MDLQIVAVGTDHHVPEREYSPRVSKPAIPGLSAILGENVREERAREGLTQLQLAQRAQINPDVLRDIEYGIGNPKIGKVIRIATALGKRTGELLAKKGDYVPCPHGVPDPTEALAHCVKRGRTKLRLTQEQFAECAHISLIKLAAIEAREGDPTLEELIRIAIVAKVEPWQLLAPWIHHRA